MAQPASIEIYHVLFTWPVTHGLGEPFKCSEMVVEVKAHESVTGEFVVQDLQGA